MQTNEGQKKARQEKEVEEVFQLIKHEYFGDRQWFWGAKWQKILCQNFKCVFLCLCFFNSLLNRTPSILIRFSWNLKQIFQTLCETKVCIRFSLCCISFEKIEFILWKLEFFLAYGVAYVQNTIKQNLFKRHENQCKLLFML